MKIKHFLIPLLVAGAFFVSCEDVNKPDTNDPNNQEQTDPETPVDTTGTTNPEVPVDTTGTETPAEPEIQAMRVAIAEFKTISATDESWYEIAGEVRTVDEGTGSFYVRDYSGQVIAESVAASYDSKMDAVLEYELKGGDYIVVIGHRGEESANDEGVVSGAPALLDGFCVRYISPKERELSRVLSAEPNGTWYKTVGTIETIEDAQTGSLHIVDGESSIYVKSLTQGCLLEENDKSFSNIGLALGDELTLVGQLNAEGELENAFYVKHETPAPEVELPDDVDCPEGMTKISVDDFESLACDDNTWYQVTGRVQLINGDSKGNMYIDNGKDEDVRMWIKELAAAEGETPSVEAFEALGLQVGDIITVRGTRDEYFGTSFLGGPAYFVKKH